MSKNCLFGSSLVLSCGCAHSGTRPPLGACASSPVCGSARSVWKMLPVSSDADRMLGCPVIWRPWDRSTREIQLNKVVSGGLRRVQTSEDVFQHPVRLFLPRSRMQEYLSRLGRTVLDSFPVQATLHFYNDEDSSSEEDEDEADAH
ncbi:protein ripply3 [Carassius gibelio]|uniref:protein ripply3 n=1 Tax=Carassius gibelio TaxID=101364 RepID=UPI00227821CB|nr:protein ripply3 [Carassius gibelio]